MNSNPELAAPVVVGLDTFENGRLAVDWASMQAGLDHRVLVLVHAPGTSLGTRPPETVDVQAAAPPSRRRRTDTDLRDACEHVRRTAPAVDVRAAVLHEDPIEALVGASQSAAMLVLGIPGWRIEAPSLFRSIAVSVAKHAMCPVVVVRRLTHDVPERVLVGTDLTPKSDPAIDFAFRMATSRSWPLTVLHSFWDQSRGTGDIKAEQPGYDDERSALADVVRPHQERHPDVRVQLLLARGFADQRLIQASRDHALVVLGHRRRPLLDAVVWGDVTAPVLRQAAGDVAVVPAPHCRPVPHA